jgi:O-succinylbenzoate synthase
MPTLKLEAVEFFHVRRRLPHPFTISVGSIEAREFLVMRGYADGLVVYGEANVDAQPFYTSETVGTVWQIASQCLLPKIWGKKFENIEQMRATWAGVRGHEFAKAAIEHLFWDLLGRQTGRSLQSLLGGDQANLPTQVEIGTSHSIVSNLQGLLDEIGAVQAEGIRRVKIKIQPGWDKQPLQAIRREYSGLTLLADANGAYNLSHRAQLQQLDSFEMAMLEQPLTAGDIVDHAQLAQNLKTPLCLDESAHDFHTVQSALKISACEIINIKVGRVGGLTEAVKIHDLCRAQNVPVWCGRRTGSGITIASELALSSLPGFSFPTDHAIDFLQEPLDHFVEREQFVRHGAFVEVPKKPGIGVEVNERLLEKITLHREKFTP